MADEFQHSVSLDAQKCIGCTSCLRQCPTEAIRIRDGRAVIRTEFCIDCGRCVRVCQHKAKKAVFDKLSDIDPRFKWRIALPAPALYGQFDELTDIGCLLQALMNCGFDEVYEVARSAEIISECTRRYMRKPNIPRPVISSACPAIVRLIRLRFPDLCENILPILPPVEYASRVAKAEALKKHPELKPDEICTVFISPCPAKTSYAKNGLSQTKSSIDYVVSMREMYIKLSGLLKKTEPGKVKSGAGIAGVKWASSGGEAEGLYSDRYLAADDMDNAIQVLDAIETGKLPALEFVELDACPGGCVGGAATVENPYIAKARLLSFRRSLPNNRNYLDVADESPDFVPDDAMVDSPFNEYVPPYRLSEDRFEAMRMMAEIEKIYTLLPQIDCGSCGAPTCRAFAEDVVKGECRFDDCIVHLKERYQKEQEGSL